MYGIPVTVILRCISYQGRGPCTNHSLVAWPALPRPGIEPRSTAWEMMGKFPYTTQLSLKIIMISQNFKNENHLIHATYLLQAGLVRLTLLVWLILIL